MGAGFVEAPHEVERVGPILMNERKLRPGAGCPAKAFDRLFDPSLLHEAYTLHVERPGPLRGPGMLQHVVERGEGPREFRAMIAALLHEIIVREDPRIDHAQHVLGSYRQ